MMKLETQINCIIARPHAYILFPYLWGIGDTSLHYAAGLLEKKSTKETRTKTATKVLPPHKP